MTSKMKSGWMAATAVLVIAVGCATDTKQTEPPEQQSAPPEQPAAKSETETRERSEKYGLLGYAVYEAEGRLWVFRDGSPDLALFLEVGEPAKSISLIAEGPDGKTVRSVDRETATAYIAAWKAR